MTCCRTDENGACTCGGTVDGGCREEQPGTVEVFASDRMNAETWNERYPVGTPVIAYPLLRPEDPIAVAYRQRAEAGRAYGDPDPCKRLETRTRSKAWPLGHGEPVVLVDGYSGGICLTHVDPDPNRPDEIGGEDR